MELGETVVYRSGLKGRVVADIDLEKFSADYPRGEWAYLAHGVVVMTNAAGLVHYENADELTSVA